MGVKFRVDVIQKGSESVALSIYNIEQERSNINTKYQNLIWFF